MSIEVQQRQQAASATSPRSTTSTSTIQAANWSPCSGPPAPARPRCCASSPGWSAPIRGSVLLDGEDATDMPVRERQVGFVFQHYALFRHMTVFENIAFGLRVPRARERPSGRDPRARCCSCSSSCSSKGWRTAIRLSSPAASGSASPSPARSPSSREVLLLDEPFGALDAKVRKELRRWLRHLHEELHITSVFVTHDQEEALEVADRVVVMNQARIEQIGTPEEIYDHPATPFVHEFLGESNALRGQVGAKASPSAPSRSRSAKVYADPNVVAYVRPHNVHVAKSKNGVASIEVKVTHVHAAGPIARVELARADNGEEIEAEISRQRFQELGLQIGDTAYASLHDARIYADQ